MMIILFSVFSLLKCFFSVDASNTWVGRLFHGSVTRNKTSVFPHLKSEPRLDDIILLASGDAVYADDEQTCCDIPVIDSRNNLISLNCIAPEMTI